MVFARTIANDAEVSIAGDLLADAQPESLPLFNLAWREFQDDLVDNGVEVLVKEAILPAFPPNTTNDPTAQVWCGWQQSFDGANYWNTPVLPPDMVEPLRLWQRQTGSDANYTQINPVNDGLTSCLATSYMQGWDWRGDAIYMNGALQKIDLRLRYSAYFADFALANGNFPSTAQVPIMRSAQALAYYVVATFAGGRGSDYYSAILARGQDCIQKLINRTARKKQRGNHRKQPYGCSGGNTLYGW